MTNEITHAHGVSRGPAGSARRRFAVILAGGQGTRLRPLTYACRKELMPIVGRPLLEYRLHTLRTHGVTDVAFACASGARELEAHFGGGAEVGLRITYHRESRPLGSGRAVKEAARAAGAFGTLVVCNGDILSDLDLGAMLRLHSATGAAVSMSLSTVTDPWHFGVASVDQDLRIRSFVEKPPRGQEPSNLINAGTWLWEPAVLDRIPDDDSAIVDGFAERVLFPGIIAGGGRIQGFRDDFWFDIGTPERYLDANHALLGRTMRGGRQQVVREDGVMIAHNATVTGPVYAGRGAVIGRGARVVGPCILGRGAIVEDGAHVENSVLWQGARVGRASLVRRSIIGAGGRIGRDVALDHAILANASGVGNGESPARMTQLLPGEFFGLPSALQPRQEVAPAAARRVIPAGFS
ncbi:MAG: NDP-sugar synthase [Chloroflexi bacterium]|nr:NDP-sugar synthase [Chloroflexota bacterium]